MEHAARFFDKLQEERIDATDQLIATNCWANLFLKILPDRQN